MHTQHTIMMQFVYKIIDAAEWRMAENLGHYAGSADDERDGYIHLSSAHQLEETARRHFSHVNNLVLVAFAAEALGPALRLEPSRGGDLFPHLYAPLPAAAALFVRPITRDGSRHVFPELVP